MTYKQYSDCLLIILKVLKKKYTNLTAEEALVMSGDILNALINYLNLKQE